jgi:two-component system, OmpR family, sensor kinase
VAVAAVRLGPRDEALRELVGQLLIANVGALAVASAVGYRLAATALAPVERYRGRADEIASGETGVRLEVPPTDDEIGRLGRTLNRTLEALERAADAQRQFLADASHELRTTLTVIPAQVELALRRRRSPAELERILAEIGDDTARLSRLADRLLDLERTRSTREPALAVSVLLETARSHAGHLMTSTDRTVLVHCDLPLSVTVDERVRQAVVNLVDNAVIHGRGTILLSASRTGQTHPSASAPRSSGTPGTPLLRVSIHDQGSGVPPDFLPVAADRFRRADAARTSTGSGLGLSIAHSAITAAGGELRLCSRGHHHTFPPARYPDVHCEHPAEGTAATLLTPGG